MYRPLPECLTIRNSEIEGLGLFATQDIPFDENLGCSHIVNGDIVIRTPLGGFYNHSDNPNCVKMWLMDDASEHIGSSYLTSLRPIAKGEEITVKYTLYDLESKND